MKKYYVFDEYGDLVDSLNNEKEAIDLAEEIDGYFTEEEEEISIRTYEQMIMMYGTKEEKDWLYSTAGQEDILQRQRDRVYNSLSFEEKAEIDAGIESIDAYLSEEDLDYWREAGRRAAMEFFEWEGQPSYFLCPDPIIPLLIL